MGLMTEAKTTAALYFDGSRRRLQYLCAATILIGIAAIAGCAQYHSHPLQLQATLNHYQQRSFLSPPIESYARRYGGPSPKDFPHRWTLNELSVVAWHWNPTIAVLQARFREQKGIVTQASLPPNPTIQFRPRYSAKVLGNPWTLGFTFNIPIETAGKIRDKVRQEQAILAARGWDILSAAWRIRVSLRADIINWEYRRRIARLKQELAQREKSLLTLITARFAGGAIARTQLARIRLQDQRSLIAAEQALAKKTIGLDQIAAQLHIPVARLRQVKVVNAPLRFLPAPKRLKLSENLRLAMANRLDVYALICRYDAAQQNLKYQIAKQYPNIHLGPGYEYNRGTDRYGFGIGVALPIFNRNQGNIAAAVARRQMLAARLTALQSRIIGLLETDTARYRAAYARWQLWRSLSLRQADAERLEYARFRHGAVSRVAWLDERLLLITDRIYTAAARERAELALTAIENDLQIPISTDRSLIVRPKPVKVKVRAAYGRKKDGKI
jgi:cobalt-zinc-cadmium efflux system outer membrane protein